MTIKELKKILEKYPDDYKVVVVQDGCSPNFPTIELVWKEEGYKPYKPNELVLELGY